MLVRDAVAEYLLSHQANGSADTTIRWYSHMLKHMLSQIGDAQLETVTTHALRQLMADRRGTISQATYKGYATALHALWAWLAEEYSIENPMSRIKRPRSPQPIVRAIVADDFVQMFNAIGDDDYGVRDRALLAFMADTGARLAGIAGLGVGRLYINDGYAIVIEKRDLTRRVVFTTYTARLLHQWLTVRSSSSDMVWTAKTGTPLTTWGIREILKRLKRRAGVTGRANPHSFRHGFARGYLLAGGDVATLAKLLGHSNLNTTAAYYAIFSPGELAELHARRSPLLSMLKENEQ